MKVYKVKDVARMLELTESQVRAYARDGLLEPDRGDRGEMRFSFQDIALMRTAKGLMSSKISSFKVRKALSRLKQELPSGRPLSALQIKTMGDSVVVKREGGFVEPASGQSLFEFDVEEIAQIVSPHIGPEKEEDEDFEEELEAEDWYSVGLDLEIAAPEHARDAYRRSLELDPSHADARINLGRLLQETGQMAAAEANYRTVLERTPQHAVARFNLGVCLEDQARYDEALSAYREAIDADEGCADAYFNLSRLLERTGDDQGALQALQVYRKLSKELPPPSASQD